MQSRLERRGYSTYCPKCTTKRLHRRKKFVIHASIPVFPGYLFVDLPHSTPWLNINRVQGVLGVLGTDDTPAPIRQSIIDSIKFMESNNEFDVIPEADHSYRKDDLVAVEVHGKMLAARVIDFDKHTVLAAIGDIATVRRDASSFRKLNVV